MGILDNLAAGNTVDNLHPSVLSALSGNQAPQLPMAQSGSPSVWEALAGALGDGLLTATGHQAVYAPIAAQNHQNNLLMQRQVQQQQLEGQRQQQLAQFKLDHPEPTAFQQTLIGAGYPVGSPEFIRLSQQKAQNDSLGVPVAVDQKDPVTGQTVRTYQSPGALMAQTGSAQQPSGPPAEAVDYLRKNPGMASQFDQKYGSGASARALGGGAGSGQPTFR